MSTTRFRIHHLALAGLLALTALTTACSDDSDDDASDDVTTTTAASGADTEEWCEAVRAGTNSVPADALEGLNDQADVAPSELDDAYVALIELVEFSAENPSDATGIADRSEDAAPAFVEIADAAEEYCGITVDLGL